MACDLHKAFTPGSPVAARVLAVNAKRHQLDLSLVRPGSGTTHGSAGSSGKACQPEGALALGRVVALGGAGVRVSLGPKALGRVALTDVHDVPVANALEGLQVRRPARGWKGACLCWTGAYGAGGGWWGGEARVAGQDGRLGWPGSLMMHNGKVSCQDTPADR